MLSCTKCEENNGAASNTCGNSFSIGTEILKPVAVGMVILDKFGEIVKEYYYSGDRVVENFI